MHVASRKNERHEIENANETSTLHRINAMY
jgi:hypothetical protein